ncbi:MAG: rhodanese-like domain-containing protein [Pseudomonadota bacterium]|nr:rhodanese-like domain-containing protein [Pseudomonadota bacterium]
MSESGSGDYAGDVDAGQAWEGLKAPDAHLVDVRTRAEWTFVGVPDLSPLGKEPLFIEWQSYPSMAVAGDFVERLAAHLAAEGVPRDAPLYFICRSGGRSQAAAMAMAQAGFGRCYNVADGFEGRLDPARHRGSVEGWKAAGLPWIQS